MRCSIVNCFDEALDEAVTYMAGVGVTGLCAAHWRLPEVERAELMVDAKRVRETDAAALDAIEAAAKALFA